MAERKLERLVASLRLETPIAHLPKGLRHAVAQKRYGCLDGLEGLRHAPDGPHSLIRTEELDTIFVHVPKAAGLSVAQALFGSNAASHTPLHMYLALYGARRFDRMYKFSFVRNPWTRCLSAYGFLAKGGLTETDRAWADANLSGFRDVDDFVVRGLSRPDIRDWVHFRSQTSFLRDPRTGAVGVDFVGQFETIAQDFATVAEWLGVTASLGHVNRSAASGQRLSAPARRVISKIYAEDIDTFGYRDPFE